MNVGHRHYRTIWPREGWVVEIIDQRLLPHRFEILQLKTLEDAAIAIRDMAVRGAPLIGAAAAYGMALATVTDASDAGLRRAGEALIATRPTAVNLRWAVERMQALLISVDSSARRDAAWKEAARIAEEDVAICSAIGDHGLALIEAAAAGKEPGEPVQILTHCNAGWLATVDWGTATAPIYKAHAKGIALHVWVDETRPRNQGAALTAWELSQHGVDCTLIADNAGGHLMQRGLVDLCIVGTDRTTAQGDVCNKIGTYLKALAAKDNDVPFYVALPSPTIDWRLQDGMDIPIEQRSPDEVLFMQGRDEAGRVGRFAIAPDNVRARNDAFDVTPARLISGLITERGVLAADAAALKAAFPDQA